MTIITKIPGVTFTDATLPKLYRDAVITAGTKWVYDALDTYSYAKQAAPVAGTDVWKDLTPNAADASLHAGASLGFSGGFTKAAAGYFDCPASGKVGASAGGFLFILWLKYGAQPSSGYSGLAGCFDSNSLGQYGLTVNNDGSNGNIVAGINSQNPGGGVVASHQAAGTILQIGLALKKQVDNSYVASTYKNGALVATVAAGTTIQQPTTGPRIGTTSAGAFADTFVGTFYRSLFDDTSTLADQAAITAMVLADYTANNGRFT